jgi:hypothetical protein
LKPSPRVPCAQLDSSRHGFGNHNGCIKREGGNLLALGTMDAAGTRVDFRDVNLRRCGYHTPGLILYIFSPMQYLLEVVRKSGGNPRCSES